jgi:putative ABC transport system ATP-binding protein
VLRGIDLDLEPGVMSALAGPSGSGKSVLLDLLAGWSSPDAGTVHWSGSSKPPSWAGLGLVPQAMGLMPDLTVWHNVVLPLRLDGGADALAAQTPRVLDLLEQLRLTPLRDRSPGELSFGEQQRVAVARAAVLEPALLLADEPTSHQDADSALAVLDVLGAVCDRGGSVLLASHADEVLEECDRVLRMVGGRMQPA